MEVRKAWATLNRNAPGQSAPDHRIAVAGTMTVDPIVPYLGTDLARATGQLPSIAVGPYDQLLQICFDWQTVLGGDPDTIVLLWRIEDFLRQEFLAFLCGEPDALAHAEARVAELAGAVGHLRASFAGTIVLAVPPFPHGPFIDIRHVNNARHAGRFHTAVTTRIIAAVDAIGQVELFDLDGVQRHLGIENTIDVRKQYLYRQPYTERFWMEAGASLARLLALGKIAPRKCVVLDCDNTLWGGVVGEDGIGGIKIGDDYPGSCFRDFQQYLLTLRAQGVMLALCSKNNAADVWEVFDNHDRMVLRREHIAAYRINWQDKPSNLIELSRELNIGLDAMVFIDDSAMEIGALRETLPAVTTIAVPAESAQLPGVVAAYRSFDRLTVTAEDRARNDMMSQERARRNVATKVLSKDDFIRSLELRVEVFPVTAATVARATQLLNKTNQFNLTTRRRDLNEMTSLMDDSDWLVMALRASDRFGDYGQVGLAIVDLRGKPAVIDTFLMSCRVLGRNVEQSFLAALANATAARGIDQLEGRFIASAKNQMVARFYPDHGFVPLGEGSWIARTDAVMPWPAHVQGGLLAEC
jgi:FkbH-like protein